VDSTDSGLPADTSIEGALREAATAIDSARLLLRQGSVIDLKGVEAYVEQACSGIPALPAPDRERLKPTLITLIDELNLLSEQLTTQHQDISGTLRNIGTRTRAVSAYKPRGSR
jgi:hypothetical protein